jgi:hypothetical protein
MWAHVAHLACAIPMLVRCRAAPFSSPQSEICLSRRWLHAWRHTPPGMQPTKKKVGDSQPLTSCCSALSGGIVLTFSEPSNAVIVSCSPARTDWPQPSAVGGSTTSVQLAVRSIHRLPLCVCVCLLAGPAALKDPPPAVAAVLQAERQRRAQARATARAAAAARAAGTHGTQPIQVCAGRACLHTATASLSHDAYGAEATGTQTGFTLQRCVNVVGLCHQ